MTDKQLEYVVTIATEGSVSRAAERLFVSQSSLSQTLARVEEELGVEIFSRSSFPLTPTYAGELFLSSASQILDIKNNLTARYKEIKEETAGRIHIGLSQDRNLIFTPIILPPFIKQYPNVDIVFTESDQNRLDHLLLDRKIDIIITLRPQIRRELLYFPILTEQMFLVLPIHHNFGDYLHPPKSIADFRRVPFILTKSGNNLRTMCNQILDEARISPRILMETSSMDVCLRMAAKGLGATIIPSMFYNLHECKNNVYILPLSSKYNREIFFAYRKEMYLSFILKEFIRIATESLSSYNYSIGMINSPSAEEHEEIFQKRLKQQHSEKEKMV